MDLAMMTTAEWDRELIANFSAQSRGLCKTEMMRIGGTATANQAAAWRPISHAPDREFDGAQATSGPFY